MGTCNYLIGHIAEDIIHISITYNTEEPQQKFRLGTLKPYLAGHTRGINEVMMSPIDCFNC